MQPLEMVEHLVGLQAQDNLPPYLSLAARIDGFDPAVLSAAIANRDAVRLLTMRGTVHVLTPDDALALRPWVQSMLDRVSRTNQQSRPAAVIASADLVTAASAVLDAGPLPVKALGDGLAERFPDVPRSALAHAARERVPMVQVPPRGLWKQSGGVVYERVETWLGQALTELDVPTLVRRYLHAYGPARAADLTTWSGVTGMVPVLHGMDDLVTHTDADGKVLHDVAGAPVADEDVEAPVRLLGKYDNLWLAHAARDRVTEPENRQRWMGLNGGTGSVVLVDGMLEGLWHLADDRIEVTPFRRFTRAEQQCLDSEIDRVHSLLAR